MFSWVHQHVGIPPELQAKLWPSLMVVVLLWILHELIQRFITRRHLSTIIEYRWRKITSYGVVIVGCLILARTWFEGFESIGTIIGLVSAGIAIALKDPIVNLAGWGFIIAENPFNVGDRVEIGDFKGDVVDQQIMQFTIMEIRNWIDGDQYTGRMVHVPNGLIFHKPLSNYSDDYPYLWDEQHVRLTFESNWQKAKEIIEGILVHHCGETARQAEAALQKASHKFLILSNHSAFEPHVYTKVEEFGVLLETHYIVEYRKRRLTAHHLWEHILSELAKHDDIMFAYPTWRIFKKNQEGPLGLDAASANV